MKIECDYCGEILEQKHSWEYVNDKRKFKGHLQCMKEIKEYYENRNC